MQTALKINSDAQWSDAHATRERLNHFSATLSESEGPSYHYYLPGDLDLQGQRHG